ncbi:hypothetical protein LCGC14_2760640, partial [marine sediment metagenome]
IETDHHEIHGGDSYTTHFDNTTTNSDNHRTAVGFKTPNTTERAHLVIEVTSSAPSEFYILEAPTIDDGVGGQEAIFDRERNSSSITTMIELSGTPTVSTSSTYIEAQLATLVGGLVMSHTQLVGGTGPKAVGGDSRGAQEWVLKQNTKYLFVLQNVGANTNMHEIELDWYEHVSVV